MVSESDPQIAEVGPRDAWRILSEDGGAVLVDVRSRPEWDFVGGPDLSDLGRDVVRLEWKTWPGMDPNPAFVGALMDVLEDLPTSLLFLCRSGGRSAEAAKQVARAFAAEGRFIPCLNVGEGFEGDLDAQGRRGSRTGWKARGLAWRQT